MRGSKKLRDRDDIVARLSRCAGNAPLRNLQFFTREKYTVDTERDRAFVNSWFPSFPSPAWERMFQAAEEIAAGARRPLQADIAVTGNCHCRCWHCFRANYPDTSDLEIRHIRRFLEGARALGTVCVGITGGEPLLRPDLLDILDLVPEGMEAQLYTTGHELTEAFVGGAEETRLTRCLVSLDHYDEAQANSRRRYPDAFAEATRAVRLLSDSSLYTAVSLCVTEDLLGREPLLRYFEFAAGLGADEIRVLLPIPQGKLEGSNDKGLYLEAMRTLRELRAETLDQLDYPTVLLFCEYESASCFGCAAGSNYVALNNDGSVTPCVAVPLSFGNVKDHPLEQIYGDMGRYFKNSGRTCYGRRVGRVLKSSGVPLDALPLSAGAALPIAAQCVVDGAMGDFFAPFRRAGGMPC